MPSKLINHSTLNNEHNWEDKCLHLKKQKTCIFDDHNKSWEVQFKSNLLTHHRIYVVHILLCGSNQLNSRTKSTNQLTPTYLMMVSKKNLDRGTLEILFDVTNSIFLSSLIWHSLIWNPRYYDTFLQDQLFLFKTSSFNFHWSTYDPQNGKTIQSNQFFFKDNELSTKHNTSKDHKRYLRFKMPTIDTP